MHLTADNWLLSAGVFTPLAGVLVMLAAWRVSRLEILYGVE